jgi:hypothetical protein
MPVPHDPVISPPIAHWLGFLRYELFFVADKEKSFAHVG